MRGRGGAGQAWVAEYGDPANSTDFPYMLAASPLENIAVPNGTRQYPAVMVGTGAPLACCPDGRRPVRAWGDVRPFGGCIFATGSLCCNTSGYLVPS